MHAVASDSTLKPQIRRAAKDDLAALLALENICFKEETFPEKQLRYLLLRAKSHVFIAFDDGKAVGSMIILLRDNISNARIYSLNVHPAYRRRGLGSLLMDEAIEFLRERGVKKITLEVGTENRAAQNLYISKGFYVDKILRRYYKNGGDALHMTKGI